MALHEPIGSASALARPTDQARSMLRLAEPVLVAAAVVVAMTAGVAAAVTATEDDPHLAGTIVAVSIFLACWTLLCLGLAGLRRYLAALDRKRWTADWARVEPQWSGRHWTA